MPAVIDDRITHSMPRKPGLSACALAIALAVAGTLWLAACGGGGDSNAPVAPADTLPPLLTGISVTDVNSESATVEWLTDEASDSQVIFGTTTAYGRYTSPDAELVTSHRVTVRGLSPSTTYHLRAKSRDAAGNLTQSVDVPVTTPAAFLIFATDTGRNLTMLKALGTGFSVQTPILQSGDQSSFLDMDLGEIHFANGRAFILFTSAITAPSPGQILSGGVHVVDLASQGAENRISLPSALTGRESRPSHATLDPEGKFLWVLNDGPVNDAAADSVFRVNVNPYDTDPDTGYLTSSEIVVGNGRHTGAFSRPNRDSLPARSAKKLFVVASQDEQRLDVIDDDSANAATYGDVVKTVLNVGAPHGMAYSAVSGHMYVGLTDGGMLILDTSSADIVSPSKKEVDLATTGWVDASIKILPAGTGDGQIPRAGYTHVSRDGKTVFTVGYDVAAGMGYLSAIDASNDRVIRVLELGDVAVGSIDELSGKKLYLPSTNAGSNRTAILVLDIDPTSPTYLTLLRSLLRPIEVGEAGAVRDGEISLNGQLLVYPDTCPTCNAVRVIDTATDRVIDTLTLTGPAANTVGMVQVPFTSKDNH